MGNEEWSIPLTEGMLLTVNRALESAAWLGIVWAVLFIAWGTVSRRQDSHHASLRRLRIGWAMAAFSILFTLTYRGVIQLSPTGARVVLGTSLIVLVAALLFWMKVRALRAYAVVETGFAVLSAVAGTWSLKDEIKPTEILFFGTSIYLIIRALDNFKKDLDARREAKE